VWSVAMPESSCPVVVRAGEVVEGRSSSVVAMVEDERREKRKSLGHDTRGREGRYSSVVCTQKIALVAT